MADPQLPEDVLVEILIRLPVKSIVKLRCVSRTWRDLIRSPVFIHRHQNRERKQSVLLVKRYLKQQNGDGEAILSFHQPDCPELLVSPNLSIPFSNDLHNPSVNFALVQIYGPCNGLVCIPIDGIIFLCNPALREFKPLPPPNIPRPEGYGVWPMEFGFGFDPNTGAYKVMQISQVGADDYEEFHLKLDHYDRFDLYDSASNSWKHIDEKLPMVACVPSFQIFFGGVLHWDAGIDINDCPYILCFDITTEAFQLLDFPDDFPKLSGLPSLTVLYGNLAMVGYAIWRGEPSDLIEIWVMEEYGKKESWTKQFVIGPYKVSPIEYGHVPLILRILECLPQRIDWESFLLALYMAVEAGNPYFHVGYNSLGAFVTINRLHFRAYYLATPFPIEKAPSKKITTTKDGVKISVIRCEVLCSRVEIVWKIYQMRCQTLAFACKRATFLTTHFSLILGSESSSFPRHLEK